MSHYFIIYYPEENKRCTYWRTGNRFFKRCEGKEKAKRISESEYMSAYEIYAEMFYNL